MTESLYVDKSANTLADGLLAGGMALVLLHLLERAAPDRMTAVHVRDCGSYYQLECSPSLTPALIARMCGPYTPIPFIRTPKNRAQCPSDLPDSPESLVDYGLERDRRAEYFEVRKGLSKEALTAQRKGEQHPELAVLENKSIHPDWDVFRAINPAALPGYNKLVCQWWTIQDALPDVMQLLFDLFATTPNGEKAAMAAWDRLNKAQGWNIKALTGAGQLFNPSQGKGHNRAKADRLQPPNNVDSFWLLEYLKGVAFYRLAITRQVRGAKDRKTYALAPRDIDVGVADRIMTKFKQAMSLPDSPVRGDVLAALRLTRALLQHASEPGSGDLLMQLVHRGRPDDLVAGLFSAFYKDLGNAVATMNLSFIGLPSWLPVRGHNDIPGVLAALDEHEKLVRQFDESHSDDYRLLQLYRDFLSGNDLAAFLDFGVDYSGYLLARLGQPRSFVRPLTEANLRRLIVNLEPQLTEILENPGFQHITYAIRQSTVVAETVRALSAQNKAPKPLYDVRYGLGQDLMRKAAYREDFMKVVCEFVFSYNAETDQERENLAKRYPAGFPPDLVRRMRRTIATTDLEELTRLIERFGGDSELIGKMLVAYGYCHSPRRGEDAAETPDEAVAIPISDDDDAVTSEHEE